MGNLPKEVTKYLRREFTEAERLQMADELAACHSRQATIDNEEAVVKQQFKVRRTQIEGTIETLVLNLQQKFTMENVKCRLEYGIPNPLEVSIIRIDTGATVEVRPMTADERQQELPLEVPPNEAAAEASAEQSAANVVEFFGAQDKTATDQPEPIEADAPVEEAAAPEPELQNSLLSFGDTQYESIPVGSNGVIVRAASQSEANLPAETAEIVQGVPGSNNLDDLFPKAVRLTVESGKVSVSVLQRELGVGYARAAQLVNLMEQNGIVGPAEGSGKREVLKDRAWLEEIVGGSERHPADEVIAPKSGANVTNIADEHKRRVAETFKPKAMREQGFKAEEPKLPETW